QGVAMPPSRLLRLLAASALAIGPLPAMAQDSAAAPSVGDWGSFGIQTQWIDRQVKPGDDFDGYVNGKWNATVTMPEDKTRIGAFITLNDLSEDRLRGILDELIAAKPAAGTPEARIAAAYGAFMNKE